MDEHTLVKQAQEADDTALNKLLSLVQPRIYRFGLRMCQNTEDAQDILQDTMISMIKTLPQFRGEASITSWAYTIARSHCIKKRRRSKYAPKYEEPLHHIPEASTAIDRSLFPDARAAERETEESLNHALTQLTPQLREVFVLRDIEGLTALEVSVSIGISIAAVKSRLHRARAQMRELLFPAEATESAGATCESVFQHFSRHLEGDLPPDFCSSMLKHVEACPHCKMECDALKKVLRTCATSVAQKKPMPDHVRETVQTQIARLLAVRHKIGD